MSHPPVTLQPPAHHHPQVKSSTYDFEANKALLKLYQFFPDLCKQEKVSVMLAKVRKDPTRPGRTPGCGFLGSAAPIALVGKTSRAVGRRFPEIRRVGLPVPFPTLARLSSLFICVTVRAYQA